MNLRWVACCMVIFLMVGCSPSVLHQPNPPEPAAPELVTVVTEASEPSPPSSPQPPEQPLGFTSLPHLEKLAELPGGHISDLQFSASNPNMLYLASNVNAMGLWKSEDEGETWARVYYDEQAGTHMNTVRIDPSTSDLAYAIDVHGYFSKGAQGEFSRMEISKNALFGLAIDDLHPTTLYLGTEDGHFWRSMDSGETWKEMAPIGDRIGPIVAYQGMVYAGTAGKGLFVSDDGGKIWDNLYKDNEIISIAVDDDALFVATPLGIWRKTTSEFEMVLGTHSHVVAIAPSDHRIIYAGTNEGVYKSTDSGSTWNALPSGIKNMNIGSLAIHPKNPEIVLMGTNIWQWSYHGEAFPESTLGEGIYKTIDGGATWRKIDGTFYDRDVDTIAVDPNDPNNIYVGTECSRGIYRSLDGGKSFEFIAGGPESGSKVSFDIGHYAMKMATDADSTVFLTGRFGITKSIDKGTTWSVMGVRRHYHGIAVSPHDPTLVIAGTSPEYFDPAMGPDNADLPGAQIVRSTDGGMTWELSNTGFPAGAHTSIHDIAFYPNDPSETSEMNIPFQVYLSTTHEEIGLPDTDETMGVYRSTDLGKTWEAANDGLTSLDVDAVQVSPKGWVFAGTKSGVFVSPIKRTVDAHSAEHWVATSLKHEVESMFIDPLGTVFVGTEKNGMFASFDDGKSWQQVASIPSNGKVMGLALSKGILYVAVNDVGVFGSGKR